MARSTSTEPVVRCLSGTVVERSRGDLPEVTSIALRSAQTRIYLSPGRFEAPTTRRMVLAKWVISGAAMMGVQGERRSFGPGDVAIHLPSIPHAFWVLKERTAMCWGSIDGPLAEQFVMGLGLRSGVYKYGVPPERKIRELAQSLKDHTVQGRRHASLLTIGLFHEIANRVHVGTEEVPSVVRMAQRMIHEEFGDADLSTTRMADRLNYHRGALSRLFHQTTGVTLIDYLTQVRLQEARMLLLKTPDKVMNVAWKSGFRSSIYFCRWIRKHTGMTPEELRRAARH